jgi:hypothetical protein
MLNNTAATIIVITILLDLQALESLAGYRRARLLILFGRHRVGKIRLLPHFLESSPSEKSLFWTATTLGSSYQLRNFSQVLLKHDPGHKGFPSPYFRSPTGRAPLTIWPRLSNDPLRFSSSYSMSSAISFVMSLGSQVYSRNCAIVIYQIRPT